MAVNSEMANGGKENEGSGEAVVAVVAVVAALVYGTKKIWDLMKEKTNDAPMDAEGESNQYPWENYFITICN